MLSGEDMQRPERAEKLPADNSIELKSVRFAYHDKEVLHGINLHIAPGTVNALVEPSCNGKSTIARLIASLWDMKDGTIELGGVDIAFGGIGINGHLAFNEAQDELTADEFAALHTRVLTISRETRTSNAIGDLNGAIDAMPKKAVTIGMAEILGAKKIRLGVFRDWHRSVIRQTAYGEVSAHFPATLIQRHPDAMVLVNANAAKQPF